MEKKSILIKQDNVSKYVQIFFMEMETLRLLLLLRILHLKEMY